MKDEAAISAIKVQGDERSGLTWKGLFMDVDNTVNFYSTRDEVVANGDGSWKWPLTRKFAWYSPYAELYGEGGSAFLQANPYVLWYALSHGIPAESFAAGANPVPKWGEPVQGNILKQVGFKQGVIHNVDMASNCIPNKKGVEVLPWIHSYFIENSLFDTAILYEALAVQIGSTKLNNPGKGESNE